MKTLEAPDWIRNKHDVSRETWPLICEYLAELQIWSKSTNLIGPNEWAQIWDRHIDDSLAILPFLGTPRTVLDIGSGAGFPGLIMACAHKHNTNVQFTLIEASAKKTAFLSAAARRLGLKTRIITGRVEQEIISQTPEIITARALASMAKLFELTEGPLSNTAKGLFHKGQNIDNELTEARESWTFDSKLYEHDRNAYIVEISTLRRKNNDKNTSHS